MPRLWTDTIEEHRREVRDAILDAAAALVRERGVRAVTMSEIAGRAGLGRATVYHYFPDVDAVLLAWHERHVRAHLERLQALRDQAGTPAERLRVVLEGYARIQHHAHGGDASPLLHRDEQARMAEAHIRDLVSGLLLEAVATGDVRADVAAGELADFCLYALAAAANLPSEASLRQLVEVTLAGLRPPTT